MANISKMTSKELEKMLVETKAELSRRDNISGALADIKKVLKKYNLSAEDVDWSQLNKLTKAANKKNTNRKANSAVKTKARKRFKRDQRSVVAPKYFNPNGEEKWTGRGRAPIWVTKICEQEDIDIKNFKLNRRFKI